MIKATLIGGGRLVARLSASIAAINDGSDITETAAGYVADYARDFVAYDTGKTHDSIRVEPFEKGHQVIADRDGDVPAVPEILEYGIGRPARPFMQPAIDLVVNTNAVAADIRATGGLLK